MSSPRRILTGEELLVSGAVKTASYVAKPFSNFGNSSSQNEQKAGEAIYKTKPENDNKPKLFNFAIKKDTSNKPHAFNNKFKFGNKAKLILVSEKIPNTTTIKTAIKTVTGFLTQYLHKVLI